MILTDYDEEKTMEMFKREYRQDGYSEGRLEGERIGYSKGEQIGYSRGEQIGYSKGAEVGYNKGEEIGRNLEKLNIAMNMKAKGMSDKEIADLLDITPDRLKEILSADRVHEQE